MIRHSSRASAANSTTNGAADGVHHRNQLADGARAIDPGRISFIDAARWLSSAVMLAASAVGEAEVISLAWLIQDPDRRDRIEPRVIKRRMKEFTLMKKTREELRQDLLRGVLLA